MTVRIWHIVVFVVVLIISAVALAPANVVYRGVEGVLTFERAEGTIWRSTLSNVDVAGLDGGNATIQLSLLDLLRGSVVSDLEFAGADLAGAVRLTSGFNGDRRIEAPVLTLSSIRVQGFGEFRGTTRVAGLDITFREGACREARGQIESDVLVKVAEVTGGEGPALAGNAACVGPVGRLTLQGDAAGDGATALLDLASNGIGAWSVTYRTSTPQLAATLIAAGFVPDQQGGAFKSKGEVTWLPY